MARPEQRKTANIRNGSGQTFTFPQDLGHSDSATQHYLMITSTNIRNNIRGVSGTSVENPLSIALHLPAGALKHNYSQRYETFQGYSAVQSSTSFALSKSQGEAGIKATAGDPGGTTALVDLLKETIADEQVQKDVAADVASDLVGAIAKKSDVAQAALIGAGVAVNPHLTLMYKGPGEFRTFALNYDFLARTQKESEDINNIILALRQRMLPAKFNTQIHSYFLQHPHHFKLEVCINPNDSKKTDTRRLFKIVDTVITNMNVDYAGSGVPLFFKDTGEPFNIKMDLEFQETRVLTKNIFEDGEGIYVDGLLTNQHDLDRQQIESGAFTPSRTTDPTFRSDADFRSTRQAILE